MFTSGENENQNPQEINLSEPNRFFFCKSSYKMMQLLRHKKKNEKNKKL